MRDIVMSWRPSRRLTTRAMWALWVVCLVATPGAFVLQLTTARHVDDLTWVPAAPLLVFLWLMLAWLWPARRHRLRLVVLTLALALLTCWGAALLVGAVPLVAAHLGAAVVVQAGVTLACYRWRIGDDNLTPHRPSDVGALLVASLVGAAAALPVGPAPGVWLTSPPAHLFAWGALGTAWMFVGGACVQLLVQRGPRTEAIPTRIFDVYVQLVVTAVSLGTVLALQDQPLTWIVMLPAVWAGLTMGPWTSAAYSLTGTVAVVVAQTVSVLSGPAGGYALDTVVMLDCLMTAFVFVVLLLSLVRDQRAHLASEVVARRQEAVDQAGLLGTVFESINEALVLMDTSGDVQLHNAAAVNVLGADKLGTEPARWLRRMGESPSFTYGYNRDGSEDGLRILAVQLAHVTYAGSDGVVAIVRDVTSEQRRIEELASFAAVAAHDLKSPLTAVQGWLEVAEDVMEADPLMATEALERGRHATDRMAQEIEDWLTYNVAREGVLQPEPVELQPVLDALVKSYPDVDFTVRTPDTVMADRTLLQHLLVNLVGNAVKYTLPGERPSVTIRSFSGGDRGWVRLYVVDAGIGIPEGEETAVFEPFRRASTVKDTYEGSGLGLALCKRIVRRHGGTITAQRNEGPGTTITVSLPRG